MKHSFLLLLLVACEQKAMKYQPRHDPMEASSFFEDGQSARPLVEGTVARGRLDAPPRKFNGVRGRERYDIYCRPCHGAAGYGDGMIVQRGFRAPPSFHLDRLRSAPDAYWYDVITRGFGAMPDYGSLIVPEDRYAIVDYVRALQRSQNARIGDVPPAEREKLR